MDPGATHKIGDLLDNATVHVLVRGTAVSLIHRKLSKYDPAAKMAARIASGQEHSSAGNGARSGSPGPKTESVFA